MELFVKVFILNLKLFFLIKFIDIIIIVSVFVLYLNIGYSNYFFIIYTASVECQAVYFGKNCSIPCIPPDYGCSCNKQCSCPVCHYIVGCIFTTMSASTDLGNK